MGEEGVSAPPLVARRARAREAIERRGLDLLIVSSLPNLLYLSGFDGSAGVLLLGLRQAWLVTDPRYRSAARELLDISAGGDIELEIVTTSYEQALADLLRRLGLARVGFEAAHMSVARHAWLRRVLGGTVDLVPTEGLIEEQRRIKDVWELARLREAARCLSDLMAGVTALVRPGAREHEIAAGIDALLREAGFTRPAFPTIVASGPNTAHPHARASARTVKPGDPVLLDFGGVFGEYCVDLTRMVSVGPPEAKLVHLHQVVCEAQAAAVAAVRPGVPAYAVDAAARAVMERHGLAEAFLHGTGHGLGIEVHEAPRIGRFPAADSPTPVALDPAAVLEPNMVFTIEPGAYVPGWGGVRIEDDVLVTAEGCEVLTAASRELIIV